MTRNGKRLGLAALLAAALGTPAFARDAETNAKKIEQIQKELGDLRKELKELRGQLTDAGLTTNQSAADLRELRRELGAIRQMLLQESATRSSFSFTPPAGRTGTIRLENRTDREATVFVNGTPNRLAPYETRSLANQPEGSFTYSVVTPEFGVIRSTVRSTLAANDTVTIFVYPRALPVYIP
jgi:hypothetical protein